VNKSVCPRSSPRQQMLIEAYERQAHQARLRNEITQSRAEQGEYLRNVELARVLDKRKARKEAEGTAEAGGPTTTSGGGTEKEKQPSRYRQREVADRSKGMEKKGMDSVLGSVFG
jgi:ESF2/ABP1 family protein